MCGVYGGVHGPSCTHSSCTCIASNRLFMKGVGLSSPLLSLDRFRETKFANRVQTGLGRLTRLRETKFADGVYTGLGRQTRLRETKFTDWV